MKTLPLAAAMGACVAASTLLAVTPAPTDIRVLRNENVLGTSFELRVRSRDATVATNAEALILGEIDRLARVFSTYSPTSEFSRWQSTRGTAIPVSPELMEVMGLADRWRLATDGAFHPGAAWFGKLWRDAAASGGEPATIALADGVRLLRTQPWSVDASAGTALRLGDYPTTLDAVAKGWIIERASQRAWALGGMDGMLLEIGGDLRVCGNWPERIALVDPRHDEENARPLGWVDVQDAALATSGGYRRHVGAPNHDRSKSHIIDPRTGIPADGVLGATVIAPDGATADALSTSFCVMEPSASLRLADATPGVACLLVLPDGGVATSGRWPAMARWVADTNAPSGTKATNAAPAFELTLSFELRSPSGGRYQRPYVAAWVEDADGFPVRTLLLWVLQSQKGQRWVPDLRRWHKGDDTRRLVDDKDLLATVSGATRNPGKYSVRWDGKDDHGKVVKPGKYTLCLEAAREHGTYQLMKHPFTLGGDDFAADLKGNEELTGARVEGHRIQSRRR